jgi:CheY-like chemotaxis protein
LTIEEPLKIIYLDDEKDLLELFAESLESDSRKIWTFSTPAGFLDRVNEIQPDVIFLDYRLPGITGDKIAMQLPPHIPCAMISGELDLQLAEGTNVDKIFHKPLSINELEDYLQNVLANRGNPSRLTSKREVS